MNLQEISKSYDFTGRTAVVTGGAGILGRAMAEALVGCGANVAVLDLKPPEPVQQDRLQAGPGQVMVLRASVLDRAELVLSLGPMTWPHMLARVMLMEQIYRAQCILTNHPYHRN